MTTLAALSLHFPLIWYGFLLLFGLALGNLVTSGLSTVFSEEAFLSYGWRIPFKCVLSSHTINQLHRT